MVRSVTRKKYKYYYMAIFLMLLMSVCYYNVLFDIGIVVLFLLDAFFVGCSIKVNGGIFERVVMQTAFGLGVIGMAIYYILLVGIGNKSVYFILLTGILLVMGRRVLRKTDRISAYMQMVYHAALDHMVIGLVMLGVLGFYIIYASAPIETYDTLTKHLPITVYAADLGKWYTNVEESIVYGEAMVLYHTYGTVFVSFGAYKAMAIFNAVLYWGAFFILTYICRKIYQKTNIWILAVIYFTTPFFLKSSTCPYLEILSYIFAIAAFAGFYDFKKERIWENLEYIALLFGFSLFTKLTNIFLIGVEAFVLVSICIWYKWKDKKAILCKVIRCSILGVLPSIGSLINIWIQTGNPFFPFMNGIFKSPYFTAKNFTDPYTNRLGISWKSILDIVFYTDKNMEMMPLGFGIYLLFIVVIPAAVGVIIWRKERWQEYVIWVVIIVLVYRANMVATYNLRYHFSNWVAAAGVITVAISVLLSVLKASWLYRLASAFMCGFLLLPNLYFLQGNVNVKWQLEKNEETVSSLYCDLLENVPSNKKVLAVSPHPMKGTYRGYYVSMCWHNGLLDGSKRGIDFWEKYVSSFDYIILDETYAKERLNVVVDEEFYEMTLSLLGRELDENQVGKLYHVVKE